MSSLKQRPKANRLPKNIESAANAITKHWQISQPEDIFSVHADGLASLRPPSLSRLLLREPSVLARTGVSLADAKPALVEEIRSRRREGGVPGPELGYLTPRDVESVRRCMDEEEHEEEEDFEEVECEGEEDSEEEGREEIDEDGLGAPRPARAGARMRLNVRAPARIDMPKARNRMALPQTSSQSQRGSSRHSSPASIILRRRASFPHSPWTTSSSTKSLKRKRGGSVGDDDVDLGDLKQYNQDKTANLEDDPPAAMTRLTIARNREERAKKRRGGRPQWHRRIYRHP